MGNGEKDIEKNEEETSLRQRRGLRFTQNLKKDHIIEDKDLFPLRPMSKDGYEPYEKGHLVGKKLKKNVFKDDHLRQENIK